MIIEPKIIELANGYFFGEAILPIFVFRPQNCDEAELKIAITNYIQFLLTIPHF
jgi:hypothetical protein